MVKFTFRHITITVIVQCFVLIMINKFIFFKGYFVKQTNHFPNRLKEERKKLGFTQAEAAEKCGISREMWGMYERGEYLPRSETLLSFEKIGININYLMTGEAQKTNISTPKAFSIEEQELLDIFRQLEAGDRHALKRQAQMLLLMAEKEKNCA